MTEVIFNPDRLKIKLFADTASINDINYSGTKSDKNIILNIYR